MAPQGIGARGRSSSHFSIASALRWLSDERSTPDRGSSRDATRERGDRYVSILHVFLRGLCAGINFDVAARSPSLSRPIRSTGSRIQPKNGLDTSAPLRSITHPDHQVGRTRLDCNSSNFVSSADVGDIREIHDYLDFRH